MNEQDSTQVTWSQVYQDFKGALSGAADALKTGSEHVYEVLVRQQVVDSITILVAYIFMATLFTVVFRAIRRQVLKNETDHELYIIVGVLGVVCLFVFGFTIQTMITGFLNPEYGAIQEVREFIR